MSMKAISQRPVEEQLIESEPAVANEPQVHRRPAPRAGKPLTTLASQRAQPKIIKAILS
jgi:hypothetical protein